MTLAPGSRVGAYEIVALIGAGGMGEVYKARDTRLDRIVALKILPCDLSDNAAPRQRFEREARAIAALQHPHICVLYDVGQYDGLDFLVMEYLEGESLAERVRRGPLPLPQAVEYARQIADALDKAHRHAIVHRDLKPANVMLTEGGAKLLDFGLAKLRPVQAAVGPMTGVTAATTHLTSAGAILGTLPYMAPEQLEAKEPDPRNDIFAFGAVLYEMVTARRAFQADSPAQVIAAIIEGEPPRAAALRPEIPRLLDRLIATCLSKNPEDRWQSAHDIVEQLKWLQEDAGTSGIPEPQRRRRLGYATVGIIGLVTVLAALILYPRSRPESSPVPPGSVVKFVVSPPTADGWDRTGSFSLSPDGKYLAVVAMSEGQSQLWLRGIDSIEMRQVPGTAGAVYPFWSPDGAHIAFFADKKLKRLPVAGGSVETICGADRALGGAWNVDGIILFAPSEGEAGLFRVDARGGIATNQTRISDPTRPTMGAHRWPFFFPDGRHFGLSVASGTVRRGSLEHQDRETLAVPALNGAYADPGYMLYAQRAEGLRGHNLLARAFDPAAQELQGEPVLVADNVEVDVSSRRAHFSVSENGVLAYRRAAAGRRGLRMADRQGNPVREPQLDDYDYAEFIGDGQKVWATRMDPQTRDSSTWLIDLAGGSTARLVSTPNAYAPVWSRDRRWIAFIAPIPGEPAPRGVYYAPAVGQSPVEPRLLVRINGLTIGWSPDGSSVLYETQNEKTGWDIWAVPMAGGRASPVVATPANEQQGAVSPDGRWLAYVSDESGTPEVYVSAYGRPDRKWLLSKGVGGVPSWRADGKELFYLASGTLVALPVKGGSTFTPTGARRLFPVVGDRIFWTKSYSASADGQRFLVTPLRIASPAAPPPPRIPTEPITVVLNWTAALKR